MGKRIILVVIDVLCLVAVSLPFLIMSRVSRPHLRGIFCDDQSIRYPYKDDTITQGVMAVSTLTFCFLTFTCGEAFLVYTRRLHSHSSFNRYLSALYKVVGTFLFGAAVSHSLTALAKYSIGLQRPDFLSVCAPSVCTGYMVWLNCTGNPRKVMESRLSFYSGHSSFGMYCMFFVVLYLQARMLGKWARLLRPTLQSFLVGFAVYVGYTRVTDNKHHWGDVLVGLLQGAVVALLNVRYLSDFFKQRPVCVVCPGIVERKSSVKDKEEDHNNPSMYPD